MRLRSKIKNVEGGSESLTRVVSVDDTLAKVMAFYKEIGITRISDITFMDRLYIPNYSVTLPGTDDIFWVYGGKGYKDSSESKRSDGINRKVTLQCIKLIQELLSEIVIYIYQIVAIRYCIQPR